MKRLAPFVLATLVFGTALTLRAGTDNTLPSGAIIVHAEGDVSSAPMTVAAQNEALQRFCGDCHNDLDLKGELSLDAFDAGRAGEKAEVGEKIVRKLRAGMMPPKGQPQPSAEVRESLVTALETTLDRAAEATPNPGHRSFQRLNRAEYGAAIRDLFGIDIDVSAFLPADTISAGFDNIADVQMPSATVMQGYLRAAAQVSRLVVGDPAADSSSTTYDVPRTRSQKERVEGAPFGTRGGTVVVHNFPADGDYKFQILLHGEPTGGLFGRTVRDIQIEVSIDGERAALLNVDRWISESDPTGLAITTDLIHVRAGPRRVAAAFIQEFEGSEDDLIRPIDHTLADTQIGTGYGVTTVPHLRNLAILGPSAVSGVSDNPVRRRIFVCRPTAAEEEVPCARRILEQVATSAYRRPLSASDLDELMPFYERGAADGGFETGVRTALQAMLASLHFIFRIEGAPASASAGAVYDVEPVDLASRLAFFLWGTIPDRELIDLAKANSLQRPEIFDKQVTRMLADSRAEALATRFAAQYFRLQDLDKIEPDALDYPYYDETLAEAMSRETELLFDHLVRANRPLMEMVTADYTFVNERLARHYGIRGVSGSAFRQVSYPDASRRGVLGHASILTLTSHGNRTSPVLRGKWVLEVLLGSPPPPPPPNVPDLDETDNSTNGRLLSVAEQLALHRSNPACSSCHNVIDPIGLALDNFDVTGSLRIKDRGVSVDTAGELFDGTPLTGVADLRSALVSRSEVVVTHFTSMLMSYAIGRRVEYFDMPAIRRIVRNAKGTDYRLSSLILGVAQSAPFRSARAE